MYINTCNACHLTNLTKRCWQELHTHTEEDPLSTAQNDPGEKEHARPSLNYDILCCCCCPEATQSRFGRPWMQTQQQLLALQPSAWVGLEPHHLPHLFWAFQVPEKCSWLSDSQAVVGLSSLWPCESIYLIFLIFAQVYSIGWIPLKTPKLNADIKWIPLNIYCSLSWSSAFYRLVQDAYKWFWVIWFLWNNFYTFLLVDCFAWWLKALKVCWS